MFHYGSRRAYSQFCLTIVSLSLLMLPMVGVESRQAPILARLGTHFLPFDAGLQAPSPAIFQVGAVQPLRKHSSPFLTSSVTLVIPAAYRRAPKVTADFHGSDGLLFFPVARAPPRA
jgi:hypothetical protein